MMKHFPTYKMKFSADAIAHTVAPSRWNVLLSQRRRWINSTIHNLAELLFLPEMCGFCLFSMRFMVFIDLLGTIILPATFAYLIYLIVIVATHQAPLPVLSIALIAAVYGLQMIIFILKREFMLIGWMFVYLLAFPIYSVFLPLYSFWSMDDFSWGNTRQVVGEGNNKTVVYDDDEPFDDSMIPLRTFKEYEANAWETTSLPSDGEQDGVSQYTRTERSRRKRVEHRSAAQSSAPGSIYGGDRGGNGSQYSSRQPSPAPYFDQRMTMFSQPAYNLGYGNPFDSPAMSDAASLRPPMFAPYASPMGSPGFPMNPMAGRGSTYSLATSANPFGNNAAGGGGSASLPPNTDPSPTDHTVLHTLRTYLNTQDLMTVTKRSAREAIYGLFPNANLQDRAAWLNENIDKILSEV
jgi:chitin synthase